MERYLEMDKTRLTFILPLAFSLAALSPAPEAQCREKEELSFEWKRVLMDGHRTSGDEMLSPSARKEKQLLQSCVPALADLKEVVAYSCAEMDAYRPQSPLGNFVADMILVQTEKISGVKCDVALTNIGGIRQSMPKGDVVLDDIVSMFPFRNNIIIADIRGDKLLALFNHMASNSWEVFSGVKVVAASDSVVNMSVGGQPLDKDKIYRVAVNSFLYNGGDGICVKDFSEGSQDTGVKIADFALAFLRDFTASGGKLDSRLDDRIVFADGVDRTMGAHEAKPSSTSASGPESVAAPVRRSNACRRLTILHTNDTHSTLEPLRFGEYTGMAGVVERAAFIDSVRTADGRSNVLLLDVGDYFQGSSYFSTFKGRAEVDAMNIMRYDVATVGNHEWDNGTAALAKCLRRSVWSTVLCNYEVDDKSIQRILKPYVIVRRGGLKIGIIGVLANITEVTDKSLVRNLRYINPVEPVNHWAEVLRNEKSCDLVIVLSHCGLNGRYVNDEGDMEFAPRLRNVDIIVGGHTHSDLEKPVYVNDADGKPLMIVTDYCKGIYVGQIDCYR